MLKAITTSLVVMMLALCVSIPSLVSAQTATAAPACQKNLRVNIWQRSVGSHVDLNLRNVSTTHWREFQKAPRATNPHQAVVVLERGGQMQQLWSGVVQGGQYLMPVPADFGGNDIIRVKVQGVLPQFGDLIVRPAQLPTGCGFAVNVNAVE